MSEAFAALCATLKADAFRRVWCALERHDRPALTDDLVRALPLPARHSVISLDTIVRGFGVRITARGARVYVLRYHTRTTERDRTYTLGSVAVWSTDAARARAAELRRIVDSGGDPFGDLSLARKRARAKREREQRKRDSSEGAQREAKQERRRRAEAVALRQELLGPAP